MKLEKINRLTSISALSVGNSFFSKPNPEYPLMTIDLFRDMACFLVINSESLKFTCRNPISSLYTPSHIERL